MFEVNKEKVTVYSSTEVILVYYYCVDNLLTGKYTKSVDTFYVIVKILV